MRRVLFASVAALMATSGVAFAVPITGSSMISFADGVEYDGSSLNFSGAANVVHGTASGSFSPAFDAGCASCVVFTSIQYKPFFASATPFYTATLNGVTTSFTLATLAVTGSSARSLTLEGTGTLTLTGFDATPGILDFSTQGGENTNVSFSATTVADSTVNAPPVPEPASLALLGMGLLGVVIARRKFS